MRRTDVSLWEYGLLVVGFLSLLGALAVGFSSPATGYELSLYDSTPPLFWVGVAVALFAAVGTVFVGSDRPHPNRSSFLLAYLTSIAIVALPLVRGYEYMGRADSLTHLGWMRDIATGTIEPTGLLYPGLHTVGLFTRDLLGVSLPHAGMLTVLAFVMVYLATFPLCVSLLTDSRYSLLIGLLVALVWLPINNVSVTVLPHSVSQAILFLPLLILLTLAYLRTDPEASGWLRSPTATGGLLALTAVTTILVHPQAGLTVLVVLGTLSVFQAIARRRGISSVAGHRPLYGQTAIAAIAFLLWAPQFPRVNTALRTTIEGIFVTGGVGDQVVQRGTSVSSIGGSLGELFLKLFLPSAVFIAIAAVFVYAVVLANDRGPFAGQTTLVKYLAVMLLPLGLVFIVMFIASITTQHFRYLGFTMLVVALLGAAGLSAFERWGRSHDDSGLTRASVLVLVLLLVPMGVVTLYGSPYIYQPSAQVTEAQLTGSATSLEHRSSSVEYTGIREGPYRYLDAVYGTSTAADLPVERSEGVPGQVFNSNLTTFFDDPQYLPVTSVDRRREVSLYRGFRYSGDGFARLETTPGIHRIQSNGDYDQYLINGSS